jgi:hypothetical protein
MPDEAPKLEGMTEVGPTPQETEKTLKEWFARIDALRSDSNFPDGRKRNFAPIREYFEWAYWRFASKVRRG